MSLTSKTKVAIIGYSNEPPLQAIYLVVGVVIDVAVSATNAHLARRSSPGHLRAQICSPGAGSSV